jgi:glutaredoxin-like protein NrdH
LSAIIVWSKPRCVQCGAVYRALDKAGVDYETRNLPDFPEKVEEFKELGMMQAPVVESPYAATFSGFNPYAIEEIIAAVKAA